MNKVVLIGLLTFSAITFAGTFNGGGQVGSERDGDGGGHWMEGKPYADDRMVSNLVWQGRNSSDPETEKLADDILHDLLKEIREDQLNQ